MAESSNPATQPAPRPAAVFRLRRPSPNTGVRVEFMPLLDVVFLLLTFFIYAMAVMVQVEALDVGLTQVAGEGGPGARVEHVLRVEPDGSLTYNDDALTSDELPALLDDLANDPTEPRLFVALTEPPLAPASPAPAVDRGPVLWDLLQRLEAAGLERVSIVGRPSE